MNKDTGIKVAIHANKESNTSIFKISGTQTDTIDSTPIHCDS